ncbi:MAG: hypothetical protein KA285_04435, partial [Bacteroidia bacterium]|nr:hypothetical protein [Bacteroidia bacterium]
SCSHWLRSPSCSYPSYSNEQSQRYEFRQSEAFVFCGGDGGGCNQYKISYYLVQSSKFKVSFVGDYEANFEL